MQKWMQREVDAKVDAKLDVEVDAKIYTIFNAKLDIKEDANMDSKVEENLGSKVRKKHSTNCGATKVDATSNTKNENLYAKVDANMGCNNGHKIG